MPDMVHSSQCRRQTRAHKVTSCIRLPSDLTLSPKVLGGALRKLPTASICEVIESLIEELNVREGDPDFELEPDEMDIDEI
jgi:hypothetical protein